MLLPYQVDVPYDDRPLANWGLVAVNVAVFGLELAVISQGGNFETFEPYMCNGWDNPVGWVTSLFLHAGILHLVGNMIFLWVFGNAVCAKVGSGLYLPLYLSAGLAAGFAEMLAVPGSSGLGASGAINGVVGMYMVFFPTNDVTCLFWIWVRPNILTLSGYWVILYFLFWDIVGAYIGGGNVGHWAHLGGFIWGFAIAIVLLKTKLVKMERDELTLLQAVGIDKKPAQPKITHDVMGYYDHEMKRVQEMEAIREASRRDDPPLMPEPSLPLPIPLQTPPEPVHRAPVAARQAPAPALAAQATQPEELVRFSCACGKTIKAPARLSGKKGKCPRCGEVVRIP
jgi:membrane associated rhomboid family serine protease